MKHYYAENRILLLDNTKKEHDAINNSRPLWTFLKMSFIVIQFSNKPKHTFLMISLSKKFTD